MLYSKALLIWLVMVVAAIANGFAREKLLAPRFGADASLPISGVSLSVLILLIAYASVSLFDTTRSGDFIAVGMFWVTLTLLFEYSFGHFITGKPWQEINHVFNITRGNLFLLVLVVTSLAPWVAAKLRNII